MRDVKDGIEVEYLQFIPFPFLVWFEPEQRCERPRKHRFWHKFNPIFSLFRYGNKGRASMGKGENARVLFAEINRKWWFDCRWAMDRRCGWSSRMRKWSRNYGESSRIRRIDRENSLNFTHSLAMPDCSIIDCSIIDCTWFGKKCLFVSCFLPEIVCEMKGPFLAKSSLACTIIVLLETIWDTLDPFLRYLALFSFFKNPGFISFFDLCYDLHSRSHLSFHIIY